MLESYITKLIAVTSDLVTQKVAAKLERLYNKLTPGAYPKV